MRKQRFTTVAGVLLAAMVSLMLAACSPASSSVNYDYLVLDNLDAVTCDSVEDTKRTIDQLQATAEFVHNATHLQVQDILKLNNGMANINELSEALAAKIDTIKACDTSLDEDATSIDNSIVVSNELKTLLDAANAPKTDCVSIVTENGGIVVDDTYSLFLKALLEVDAKDTTLRKWSDALSTPLEGKTPEEMRQMLNRAICEEPFVGVSLAHLFAHLEVSGVSILSLQSTDWLKPYAVDTDEIDELVAQFVPLEIWRFNNPGKKTAPDSVYVEALKANHDYQALASRLVFLLSRYQLKGVDTIGSTHHYHLVAGGLRADGIPEVEISTEKDAYPSLVFYLTEKTSCKPISVLAFNTGDKRPMLGDIPDSCVTSSEKCISNCGSTPPPACPPGEIKNQNGKCVTPKSSDAKDYPYPADKPKVTAPSNPQETPDPVQTSQPGGGGVSDSPSKSPGSETGVQAPGSTPAPTTPAPVPPNEGGSNESGDPGGF